MIRDAKRPPCGECNGTGEVEVQIGGDGYGGKCAGLADVPAACPECGGSGDAPEVERAAADPTLVSLLMDRLRAGLEVRLSSFQTSVDLELAIAEAGFIGADFECHRVPGAWVYRLSSGGANPRARAADDEFFRQCAYVLYGGELPR